MFLLDSLLLAPGKAVVAMLEAGTISEKEFDTREVGLLQRLEQIARAKFGAGLEAAAGDPGAWINGEVVEGPEAPAHQAIEEAETMLPVAEVIDAPRLLLDMPVIVARPHVEPQI